MRKSYFYLVLFLLMVFNSADADYDEVENDGLYCNGPPGKPPIVCNDSIPCTIDRCNNGHRACEFIAPDKDGDGYRDASCLDISGVPLGSDCDDNDNNRYPGNVEVCDAFDHDEDCNVETFGTKDEDGDGFISVECGNWVTPDRPTSTTPRYIQRDNLMIIK